MMDPEYLKQQVKDAAVRAIMLRRELHQWPEPGNEEFRTAGIIERELKDLGFRVERLLPTGLICTIPCESRTDSIKGVVKNAGDHERSGDIAVKKGIALRADMDGLPIEEKVSLSFSSSRKGYMHACGHDVHTAVLLGVSRVIEKNRHMLKKDVKLIFQPAEETTGGAERMIAAGCLENPDISSVFGLHIKPELHAGKIGIKYGRVHAASDMFSIRIKGRGSHGAFPEKGVDALLTGCQVVNCLQTAVSRSVPAFEPAVLTVGTFRSGSAANVIAEEAILEGTIRSFDPEIGCVLRRRTEDIVRFTALAAGAEGACIQHGMRAATGAIEGVKIQDGEVILSVIGDEKPVGICGSGLIDCVAELLKAGIITEKGKLLSREEAEEAGLPDSLSKRLLGGESGKIFILYADEEGHEIYITQKDIREVQLAKGAIRAGVQIMMQELGLEDSHLNNVFLAGAFGNYIKKESALTIGLLPAVSRDKVISIGNAAGAGACMALLSKSSLEEANRLAEEVNHIELAEHPDFQKVYLQAMYF